VVFYAEGSRVALWLEIEMKRAVVALAVSSTVGGTF
jgi:hypothetical protein